MQKIKYFYLFPLIVLFTSSVYSGQFKIGISGGINLASVSLTNNSSPWYLNDRSMYIGTIVGGIVQMEFDNHVFIRCEPRYIQKGTDYKFSWGYGEISESFKLDLIEFPLSIGYHLSNGSVKPYIFAGPNLGYLLTDGYNTIDFALDGGIGIETDITENLSLIFDARYSYGLINIYDSVPGDMEINTRGIQPLLGVLYHL